MRRAVLAAAALVLAALGVAASFAPQEILAALGAPATPPLVIQLLGACYVAFAMLDWIAKDSLIGGIYNRPVAMANVIHFAIGALALVKGIERGAPPALIALTAVYALFAIAFAMILFTSPVKAALLMMVVCTTTIDAQLLDKITATVSPSYDATIRGAAGAVAASALVAAVNLNTGHYSIVQADAVGAFEAQVFAPGATPVLIKVDPSGDQLRNAMQGNAILGDSVELQGLAGTVVQIPDSAASQVSLTMSGLSFGMTLPGWVAEARLNKAAYARGEALTVEGTYTALGSAAAGQTPEIGIGLVLMGVSRADGRGTLDHNTYCSTVMTPTGLPIERGMSYSTSVRILQEQRFPLQAVNGRLQASFRITTDALDVPDGYYRLQLLMLDHGMNTTPARRAGVMSRLDGAARRLENHPYGLMPVMRIGNPAPPRLYWSLLAGTTSQGSRGVIAVEDRDRFALATRIAISPERFVIPQVNKRTGAPIRYSLEPHAPTVAVSNRGEPINPPTIPFRFPSGSLTVTIKRPNGNTLVIGPAPFRQVRLMFDGSRPGVPLDANHLADAFQLTTLDSRFEHGFTEEGVHEIAVAGTIEDVWGNVWAGGGTYQVDVGRTLEIDSAMLPGTPLEAGDFINAGVQVLPGVPADVEVRYRFAPASQRAQLTTRTLHAKANAHGYAAFEAIQASTAGEYRIDVTATYRDARGHHWAGARTWGGVVAQRAPAIELHGLRGVDDQQSGRLAWFSRKQIGLSRTTGGHVNMAFHSGDVQWLADDGDAATLNMGIHDPQGLVADELLQRDCGPIEDKIVIGEAPFHSTGPLDVDPHVAATTENDLWAYAYRFVERPRVRVREIIAEQCIPGFYWRFDDRYGRQTGTGANGDLPNDFKFQFGGVALYGRTLAAPVHAIYGSLFVVIDKNDPGGTRVFPPFQGNGGGPSGGPLFTLKGRGIDLFFHPTAVRPGSILHVGNIASFAGHVAPTLPSKVEIVVTSPSGVARTIAGTANKIGWFYQPASDFVVNEPGVWRARVRTTHEGKISAGVQLTAPFPTGDVLGSRDGEFYFYVVDANAPPLGLAAMPQFVQPARGPIAFTVVPQRGVSDVELFHTTTMPGYVLEEAKLPALRYTYDASKLAKDYPNLDLDDIDAATGVDTIVISFLLSGKENGVTKYFARQVVLEGEELLIGDAPTRRRGVRH